MEPTATGGFELARPRRERIMADIEDPSGDTRRSGRPRASQAEGGTPSHGRGAGGEGQGGEGGGAAFRAWRMGAGLRSARSRRVAGGAGGFPGARAGADPLRADAGVAVHVLPRRGLPDGGRSGRRAPDRAGRAALWRCASVQLRGLRRARSAAGVQHQRLRRDAAGPVRVGREAARGELRRGRPGSRLRRETAAVDQPGRDAVLPGGDQGSRRVVQPRPLVLPHRRGRDRARCGSSRRPGSS